MAKLITLGSPTCTGGKVITASSSMVINGQKVALLGDTATCQCGRKNCKGQGIIVRKGNRNFDINGISVAVEGDEVLSGCGSCFLSASSHDVELGGSTQMDISIGDNGRGFILGNGVVMQKE
ncbi:PAAR domain-containing protein [Vibrio alginolyticus]|uniref:PAAR domain-containing protein n=1 Tax=Vibrio alginolyticus TaxID=663 RepID=UPI00211A5CEC|nr:PAAR domain-containing protein [Vibrio alginolyticus]MCQ9087105.1 PAAR domain-containing protein [Vibrio alginolyticus]